MTSQSFTHASFAKFRSLVALKVPVGWRVTDRPLTIAVLGWARLSMQAREGSGYNLSASELAAGLVLSGHRVAYLRSGMEYSIVKTPCVRMHEWWRGVACFDFFNSRNVAPASSNFKNMAREMSSPDDARVVLKWLDLIEAQVVHVHSLEGYGLDLIGAIRDSGRAVVVTPHNYWYACPQVDLLHEELRVCEDYEGGAKCVGCLPLAPESERARSRRGAEQAMHRALGPVLAGWARQVFEYAKYRLKGGKAPKRGPNLLNGEPVAEAPQMDPEAALGFDSGGPGHSGEIDHGLKLVAGEKLAEIGSASLDQNERFLRADHHLKVVNQYGARRVAGIQALNRASLVTPPSRFLLDVMKTMGMSPEIGRHVRLGQPHFDQLHRKTQRSPYYSVRPWDAATSTRPIRFGFMGTTRNNKGLEVLARAIPLLDVEVRQRSHFLIRAAGYDWTFRKRLSVYPEVSFLGGYDGLQLISTMDEFDVGILPHIWFENSPLVLLEFLHAGKFVISSRLGGPPEWINEPGGLGSGLGSGLGLELGLGLGNGLLFSAGEASALAACITRVVRGEVTIPSAAEVHAVSELRSYPEHVAEFEEIYRALVDGVTLPGERGTMTVGVVGSGGSRRVGVGA